MPDDDTRRPHLRLIPGSPGADAGDAGANPSGHATNGPAGDRPEPGPDASARNWPPPPGAWSAIHDLTGRTAIVLGGAETAGTAIATGIADYGARIAIADRDLERAKATARAASRPGNPGSLALQLDPTRPEQVRRGLAAVEQVSGRIDILLATVSLSPRLPSATDGPAGLILGEMAHLVRAAARRMAVRGGGQIVLVASGVPVDPAQAAMIIGGLSEFVRTMAAALISQQVSVTGIVAPLPARAARPDDPPGTTEPDDPDTDDESGPAGGTSAEDPRETSAPDAGDEPGDDEPSGDDTVISQAPVVNFPTPEQRQRAEEREAATGTSEPEGDPDVVVTGAAAEILRAAVATGLVLSSPSARLLTGQVFTIGTPTVLGVRTTTK